MYVMLYAQYASDAIHNRGDVFRGLNNMTRSLRPKYKPVLYVNIN